MYPHILTHAHTSSELAVLHILIQSSISSPTTDNWYAYLLVPYKLYALHIYSLALNAPSLFLPVCQQPTWLNHTWKKHPWPFILHLDTPIPSNMTDYTDSYVPHTDQKDTHTVCTIRYKSICIHTTTKEISQYILVKIWPKLSFLVGTMLSQFIRNALRKV